MGGEDKPNNYNLDKSLSCGFLWFVDSEMLLQLVIIPLDESSLMATFCVQKVTPQLTGWPKKNSLTHSLSLSR